MSSGAYAALTGLRARTEQLERLATDIANATTAGYKASRGTTASSSREGSFESALSSAIDVSLGPVTLDFRQGALAPTGRDLDLAIDGEGFFVIETENGPRYTRNGHFTRRLDGSLSTIDGDAVLGENGTPLKLPPVGDQIKVNEAGELMSGGRVIGRPRVVDFDEATYNLLQREGASRFRAPADVDPAAAEGARVVGGVLEQSNVSVVERMAELVEVSRGYEGLQRGITTLMNDLDGRAATELGRR